MITRLPVPPLAVRPSVQMGSGGRSHDDLTNQYAEIIKANNGLSENIENGVPPHIIDENVQFLQFKVATLFDNRLPNMPMSMQVGLFDYCTEGNLACVVMHSLRQLLEPV